MQINGQVVEEPMARVPNQLVTLDPHANLMQLNDVTLLLHKPPAFDALAALGGEACQVGATVAAACQPLGRGPIGHAHSEAPLYQAQRLRAA